MTIIQAFVIGAGFALLVSLVTVLVLRPHLARLLRELCGSQARANFWVAVSGMWVLMLGFLAGTTQYGYDAGGRPVAESLFFGLVTQVRACLIGLLVSLLAVTWVLLGFIRRFELGISPAPPLEPEPIDVSPFPREG
jgi:hypothetical protein